MIERGGSRRGPTSTSGRPVSATTATPATSSASCCGGSPPSRWSLFIELAEGSNTGLREDLGDVAALFPRAVRQLALAVAQVVTVLVPIIVAVFLVAQRRWRRTLVVGSGLAGRRAASSSSSIGPSVWLGRSPGRWTTTRG